MSFSASSLLDMGKWALFASQVQLQVTGENISNVDNEDYSRRTVNLEEANYIDYSPGQMGTGVRAVSIERHFNAYVESMYLNQACQREKWDNFYQNIQSVESLFNESNGTGISNSLSEFFTAWNDLSQLPDDYGSRQAVINQTSTLVSYLKQVDSDLASMQSSLDSMISQDVNTANSLMQEIADLNTQINIHHYEGHNNANSLFDERAAKVRDLGEILDITTIDNGGGEFTVLTEAGHTLVDGSEAFSLEFNATGKTMDLERTSLFDGDVYYTGSADYEYTLEFLASGAGTGAGPVSSGGDAAQFRVSLDGGVTWLKDASGSEQHFSARSYTDRVEVEGLDIWFGSSTDPNGAPTQDFTAGDTFTITPHSGVYWVQNTSSKLNITSQIHFNGEENTSRITGGSLGANLELRDAYIGEYSAKLDSMAETLIWETNRRHSQGAGLQNFTSLTGTYSVTDPDKALGSNSSGLVFGDKLTSGSSTLYIYDSSTGMLVSNAGLNFGSGDAFNPDSHSLTDVRDAYNNTFGSFLTADIVNNQLRIESKSGYEFAFGTDTSGLNAALGLNTYFTGSSAGDIGINNQVSSDIDFLATGHVNGSGEINEGDNTTALNIYNLSTTKVSIKTLDTGTTSQTIQDFYNGLVGSVGSDTSRSSFNYEFYSALASDLNEQQQQVAGVNLDEEMSNLIRYQHSFTAAAKLITTADEMMQTILSLRP